MRPRLRQLDLPAPRTWGGTRKGAGRKPKGDRAGVPHDRRPALSHRHPAHVTLRVLPHVWNLRSRRAFRAIGRADMIDDPRFRTNADRVRNADDCEAPIAAI